MDSNTDYYAALGVMPDAEDVVVIAAYRALVGRYHPDRWNGDPRVAHSRTASLNDAYAVLSDKQKRAAYDRNRAKRRTSFIEDSVQDAAFDAALTELEQRWQVAVGIFPDLADTRQKMVKIAYRLAFAYVVVLLESKRFDQRHQIAQSLEISFLKTYFGSNPKIIDYVRELIFYGFRDAVKGLNQLVDVMGDEVPAELLIKKIDSQFFTHERRLACSPNQVGTQNQEELRQKISLLRTEVARYDYPDKAFELAQMLGYTVEHESGRLFSADRYSIYKRKNELAIFETNSAKTMTLWIRANLL